ncbi:digestive organ expansion factor homolog [Scaptodrosophila lebanonensis]|uniref:U3 small nucleolar RNA-associated protein 25 homolog n=1 Tax=Drosophila lebanonensis TaxID=7225 RepID=A0A6J2T2L7_DROLE|nr:digestive organ expansion factor homolog [Scaptodrosophila lebanonensis]
MRGKLKKGLKRPNNNHKIGAMSRNDRFPKNNRFIQRSKQMEDLHRKEHQLRRTVVHDSVLEVDESLLPNIPDETGFYEKLVLEYNHIGPTLSGSHSTSNVKEHKNVDNSSKLVGERDEKKCLDEQKNSLNIDVYKSFTRHFNMELTSEDIENLITKEGNSTDCHWEGLGNLKIDFPNLNLDSNIIADFGKNQPPKIVQVADIQHLEVKTSICGHMEFPLTQLQSELFNILTRYIDIYYPYRSHCNAEEIRYIYCIHMLNHLLKSRSIILRNNEKVAALAKSSKLPPSEISIPEIYRDQGLKRMKALIIVPFRESALKTVNILTQLLFGAEAEINKKNGKIAKYERFVEDYSGNTMYFPKTNPKPLDYERTFSGNTDDNFKMGIRFTKKSISLFADLNSSDILIASPLALRMLINDKDQDYDFLNSIELLIIDQAELFLAQNWENLLFTLDHLHMQPQKFPDTNCQRVRTWCLNGSSRFYRQTLLFCSHDLPEFRAVLSNKCHNFEGKIRFTNMVDHGDIRNVLTPIQQVFRRVNCSTVESIFEDRFQYFVNEILPQFTGPNHSHCMLYVPSYFDYVRLRNHFKKEMISFVQISEYTKKEKVSRARDIFFHSGAPFLLYSERAHFFRRTRIKGIRHLIMYQPPNFPNFYSELINLMLESNQNPRDGLRDSMSVTILYTTYDLLSLGNIVGSENAVRLAKGNKNSYLFSTNQ